MSLNLPFIPSVRDTSNLEKAISGIWSNIKGIWGHLNVEVKNHDYVVAPFNLPTGVFFHDISDIPAGITGGTRNGDKLRMRDVNIKLKAESNSSTSPTEITVILLKHYDNFLGNYPSFDDIYDTSTVDQDTRLRNLEHTKQYRILTTRRIRLEPNSNEQSKINIYYKFTRRVGSYIEWDGPSGTADSNGKLYLVYFRDGNASTNPYMQWTSRIKYIDN